ncbi:MAG: hypothetical protein ACE5I2_16520, partial [Anaerolineae bacterium]
MREAPNNVRKPSLDVNGPWSSTRRRNGSADPERTPPNQPASGRRGYRWLFYGVIPLVVVAAVALSLFQTVRST